MSEWISPSLSLFVISIFVFTFKLTIFALKNEWDGTHLCLLSTSSTADQTLHFPMQSEHSSCETEPSLLCSALYGFG